MSEAVVGWPKKSREQQWAVWDSARLNDFEFRADDIMICTWSKSGTTWMQQIVGQLVFQGDPDAYGQQLSPWIEFRLVPKEEWFAIAEAQTHRRFLKTHSPLDAIPYLPDVKYIYVGRDVRDIIWSMYHHQSIFTPGAYEAFNSVPGRVGPPMAPHNCDVRSYYRQTLENGQPPGMYTGEDRDIWSHVQGYWNIRSLPNIHFVHYANLKSDFRGEVQRIADFLGIDVDPALWGQIEGNCSIKHMRALASRFELLDAIFEGGGNNFINKGTNGRWKDILSAEEIAMADEIAAQRLTPECAHWLKTGELPD